jgi:hypothetical protein
MHPQQIKIYKVVPVTSTFWIGTGNDYMSKKYTEQRI